MQLAIILHMAFAVYMFSNSQIFQVSSSFGINLSSISGSLSSLNTGTTLLSASRLSQPHVVLYLAILIIIAGIFILTKVVNTFFPGLWSKLACCFRVCESNLKKLKEGKFKIVVEQVYSNNIYREIIIDDLRREFEKTINEVKDYKQIVEAGSVKKEGKAVEYLIKKLESK